jgi:hypothetical protein
MRQSANGSFIVGGYTQSYDGDVTGNHSYPDNTRSDAWLLRISPYGDILWAQCIGGNFSENFSDMVEFPNGRITLLGGSNTSDHSGDVLCDQHGQNLFGDVWLVGSTDTTMMGLNEFRDESDLLKVYPNPAGNLIHFEQSRVMSCKSTIFLFNMFGQLIDELLIPPNQKEISFSCAHIPEGCYSFIITNPGFAKTGKIIILR